jgi:hypothetical protein
MGHYPEQPLEDSILAKRQLFSINFIEFGIVSHGASS